MFKMASDFLMYSSQERLPILQGGLLLLPTLAPADPNPCTEPEAGDFAPDGFGFALFEFTFDIVPIVLTPVLRRVIPSFTIVIDGAASGVA
jgi:hypothetical protein